MAESRRAPARPAAGLRERNKRAKEQRILEAARALFRERGFEATTGRAICERAGIGTGTLFLYVKDKRGLLSLLFEPLARRAFDRLPRGLDEDEEVVDALMRLFGALYGLYARDPRLSRVFVQELLFRSDPDARMAALAAELRVRVAEIVEAARARGRLRGDVDAATLGHQIAAHYVLWLQLWLGIGAVGRRAAERGLRRALELALSGIGPRA
jgi:AcrR family transcriptional regulator